MAKPAPPPGHSVLAAGEHLAQSLLASRWDSPEIQRILCTARQRFGHALCTCRPQPLKLQIRLRAGKCHLAVWPQEHLAHDAACLFFHEPLSGGPAAATVTGAADPRSTRTALWLGATPAAHDAVPVSLGGLGLRLWEAASLCRWHPDWSRDWSRSRYELQRAACAFALNGQPLESLLFVPRPYRPEVAAARNQEWDAFLRSVFAHPELAPRLLLAPVRRLRSPQPETPAMVWLRHLRAPVPLGRACWVFLVQDNANGNCRIGTFGEATEPPPAASGSDHRPELVGLFQLAPAAGGALYARAAWLLPVHPRAYLPAANAYAVEVLDALLAGDYAFQRLLSPEPPSQRTLPDLLVRHVRGPDGVPVARAALEVVAAAAPAPYLAARAALAQRMASQGIPTWVWRPQRSAAGATPALPLPPAADGPAAAAAQRLQRIAEAPDVDYGYGFTAKLFPGADPTSAATR